MTVHVALLKGINIAGHKQVAMADLRALATRIGLDDPRTLLQSGNLVFRNERRTPAQLERLLEAETERRLRLRVSYFVRTAPEWRDVIARNPFPAAAAGDPGRLAVLFLRETPGTRAVNALRAAIVGRETVHAAGRQLYVVYPDGMGRSKLTHTLIEKTLGTLATGRNWNTVRKLADLAVQME
jgi:uncharacterized protein (DUF1697 family)